MINVVAVVKARLQGGKKIALFFKKKYRYKNNKKESEIAL